MTDKKSSQELAETLKAALLKQGNGIPAGDITLTDSELDDVAGGVADCTAMCGTFKLFDEAM